MINPPFNYTGSKIKLLPQLIPLFDRNKLYFVDLFAGGGSVYANVVDLYEKVWVNDIIADLIGAHKALLSNPSFVEQVKALCVARDDQAGYHKLRDSYNAAKTPEKLFALMLCCTNNMMRFNQSFGFNQTFGKRTFNDSTVTKIDAFVNRVKPHMGKLHFTSLSFEKVWPANLSNTIIYADPPYMGSEAGYNAYWSGSLESRLYDYLKNVDAAKGSFALSGMRGGHKDQPESPVISRLIADGYRVMEIQHDYSKVARNKIEKRGQEVLILNYSA